MLRFLILEFLLGIYILKRYIFTNFRILHFLKVDYLWNLKGKSSMVNGSHSCHKTIGKFKRGGCKFFKGKWLTNLKF